MNQWISKLYVFLFLGGVVGMVLTGFGSRDNPKALAQREGLNMVAKSQPAWQGARNPGNVKITEVFTEASRLGKGVRFKGEFTPQCDLYKYDNAIRCPNYTSFYDLPDSPKKQYDELAQDFRNTYIIEVINPKGKSFNIDGEFDFLKNEKDKLVMELRSSRMHAAGIDTGYSLEYLNKNVNKNGVFYLNGSSDAKKCISNLKSRANAFAAKVKKLNALKKQERDSKDRIARLTWKIQSQQEDVEYIKRSMIDRSKKEIARRQEEKEPQQEKYENTKTPSQQQTDNHNKRITYLNELIAKANDALKQAETKLENAEKALEAQKQKRLQQEERLNSIQAEIEMVSSQCPPPSHKQTAILHHCY